MKRFRTVKPLENLVVNHVGPTSPSDPWVGMFWFDTSSNTLKVCTQVTPTVTWISISGAGGDADTVDGFHAGVGQVDGSWYGRIPVVSRDGVLEIGKYIDFHQTADETTDFSPRLFAPNDRTLAIRSPSKRTRNLATETPSNVVIYVDNVIGCDETGNGTEHAPFATFDRAMEEIGQFIRGNVTIVLKASPNSYGTLDVAGLVGRSTSASLTIRGEMDVLVSGTLTGFSNSVNDPVYGSAVEVARIVDSSGNWVVNQFKHKILRVYKGTTSYYRVITNNDVNSLYCSYTFPVTLDSTWSYEILDWGTKCDSIRVRNTSINVNFQDISIETTSPSEVVEAIDCSGVITISRAYLKQNYLSAVVLSNSFLNLVSCIIDKNNQTAATLFPVRKGVGFYMRGVIIENESGYLLASNTFRFITTHMHDGCRVYAGSSNPVYLFNLITPSFVSFASQHGKVVLDAGITCFNLQNGATVRGISHVYFGPNVTIKFHVLQDAVNVSANGLLGSHIGSNITNPEQLHSRLQVAGSVATQTTVTSSDVILGIDHHIVLVDASTGNRTVTLPDASTCVGRQYVIKKIDSTGNVVTIVPHTGQTIDGMSSYVLEEQYQFVSIVSVQVGNIFRWMIIGR